MTVLDWTPLQADEGGFTCHRKEGFAWDMAAAVVVEEIRREKDKTGQKRGKVDRDCGHDL